MQMTINMDEIMNALVKSGIQISQESGFVACFGFVASSSEDLKLAQAFMHNMLKAMGGDDPLAESPESSVIEGSCTPLPVSTKKRLGRHGRE
jgi:hypothetical protein